MQNLTKMKALYKSIFFCLTLVLGLSACTGKNEEMPPTGGLDHAEQLAVGTYVGTWSRTNLTTGAVESGAGSITFEVDPEKGNNVSKITVDSDALDLGMTQKTSACNISRLSSGVLSYWNLVTSNAFGIAFNGKISPEGVATMQYNKIVRSGRKEVEFSYSFSGNKQ